MLPSASRLVRQARLAAGARTGGTRLRYLGAGWNATSEHSPSRWDGASSSGCRPRISLEKVSIREGGPSTLEIVARA